MASNVRWKVIRTNEPNIVSNDDENINEEQMKPGAMN